MLVGVSVLVGVGDTDGLFVALKEFNILPVADCELPTVAEIVVDGVTDVLGEGERELDGELE